MSGRISALTPARWIVAGTFLLAGVTTAVGAAGQSPPVSGCDAATDHACAERQLEGEIQQLRAAVLELRTEVQSMRAETANLRAQLAGTPTSSSQPREGSSARLAKLASAPDVAPSDSVSSNPRSRPSDQVEARIGQLEEDQQVLKDQVSDQYQSKVESASKYRVKLSGLLLLNLFSNRGSLDNLDVPNWAQPRDPMDSNSAFGGTVRQSLIGLEVFGPEVAGARTRGEIQMDFYGGFPSTPYGVTVGLMRVRTGTVHFDWNNTSVVAGQDSPFFSPLSPTSIASLANPAFAYSGNLWVWTPQLRIEHRMPVSDSSQVIVQGGILDALTGEAPPNPNERTAQAGERSGQPAYAARVSLASKAFDSPLSLGIGGFYSRQNWGFGRHVDGWAGTADWDLPLSHQFALSGEFYRGRSLGGLGGGLRPGVVYNGPLTDPATAVFGLNATGGWGQLKYRATDKLEFNGAFGLDNPFASDLKHIPAGESSADEFAARDRTAFVNFLYRPRSDLLLSLEYRKLWSFIQGPQEGGQINAGIGILF
jgi:hypothetical protein